MTDCGTHNREIHENALLWERKPLLRRIYRHLFSLIAEQLPHDLRGSIVEIGSGIGKIKEVIPQCVTTDLFPNPGIDRVENIYRLSFPNESVAAFLFLDVFHHLTHPGNALAECRRALLPGGRIIVLEPAISLLGSFVYGCMHHEPIAWHQPIAWWAPPNTNLVELPYYAAQGNASRIFWRGKCPKEWLTDWQIVHCIPLTLLSYILTGGFRGPTLAPTWSYDALRMLDRFCQRFPSIFATRLLVVLEKR